MVIPDWARTWQATLFDHGWMIPGYPPELGGRDATPTQTLIFLEELARLGIPRSVHFGGYAIVGPSLLEFGDEAQRAMAPAAIRGDTVWCVGMSEPNAGSDLANLSTRAIDDGDSFVVNGQKVWTSYAMVASKCFCYVRTDPDVPKHKGISVLIIDLDTPGVEVRPLRHISGRAEFAEVFFSDVVVPKANLIGELNDGWRITMGSLAHERGALWVEGVMGAARGVDDLVTMARSYGLDGDPVVRRQLAELAMRVRSLRALGYKGFATFSQGSSAPEHSYMKLATSELRQRIFEQAIDLQGPDLATLDRSVAADGGRWQRSWMTGLASTIGGGTSEIQRNVIATRVLGLPRS
jgi:alkylation response protein AidB-like acyl-CoA dehydrogenase